MHRLTLREVAGRMGRGGAALCQTPSQPGWVAARLGSRRAAWWGAAGAGRSRCARALGFASLRAARGPFGFATSRARLAPLAARPERWSMLPREMTQKGQSPSWVILTCDRVGHWGQGRLTHPRVRAVRSRFAIAARAGGVFGACPQRPHLGRVRKTAASAMRIRPSGRLGARGGPPAGGKAPVGTTAPLGGGAMSHRTRRSFSRAEGPQGRGRRNRMQKGAHPMHFRAVGSLGTGPKDPTCLRGAGGRGRIPRPRRP